MKKSRVLSLVLCLALLFSFSAQALEISLEDAFTLYSGMIGHIAFSLPSAPQRVTDADYPGMWTNSIQLSGFCSGGEEFQFLTADISQWIIGMKNAYPDESEYHIKANTLLQYAAIMILQFDGELDNMKASEKDEFVAVSFTYTYPDAPGVPYEGRAFLENGTAVCLIGAQCDELTQAFERMIIVSDEEMAAFSAREPEEVRLGALNAIFPAPVTIMKDETATYAACFTSDFSYISIQYMLLPYHINAEGEELQEILMEIAKNKVIPAVQGKKVYDAVMSLPAPDTALLTFSTINTASYGEEYGQKFLCRLYIGIDGICYVYAAATETGAAFMDALTVTQ